MTPDPTLIEQVARALCSQDANKDGIWFDDAALKKHILNNWRKFQAQAETAIATIQGSAALPSEAWELMETAPRDGSHIQLWHERWCAPIAAYYVSGCVCPWFEVTRTTRWPAEAFTHWQPLPAPPAMRATTPTAPIQDTGVPCGTGSRASHEASISVESSPEASIPNAVEYDTVLVPMVFERPVGHDFEEWRTNVSKTELYRRGDTVLVWVNEGDLYCDGPFVKQLHRKPVASGTEAGTGETEGLDPKDDGPVGNAETPNPGSTPETGLVEALRALVEARDRYLESDCDSHAEHLAANRLDQAHEKARAALSNVLPDEV